MPFKEFKLKNNQNLKIYKRKNSKNLRLHINSFGEVKLSIPYYAPYIVGLNYANKKLDWINKHVKPTNYLEDNQQIGKAHRLKFISSANLNATSYSISTNIIEVKYPLELLKSDTIVQKKALDACYQALKKQAENLLPDRLNYLSSKYGFEFNNLKIKKMRSRWGSCDQNKDITLSYFLMLVPWQYIDYVLIHELAHTLELSHNENFWFNVEKVLPEYKKTRRELRNYPLGLISI